MYRFPFLGSMRLLRARNVSSGLCCWVGCEYVPVNSLRACTGITGTYSGVRKTGRCQSSREGKGP